MFCEKAITYRPFIVQHVQIQLDLYTHAGTNHIGHVAKQPVLMVMLGKTFYCISILDHEHKGGI